VGAIKRVGEYIKSNECRPGWEQNMMNNARNNTIYNTARKDNSFPFDFFLRPFPFGQPQDL
jgi:hypothetical protein